MTGEQIVGMVIMCATSFGCGILFYGIGAWAQQRKEPMHFYSGTKIDPKTISDIPMYNEENARMWKLYSLPYFLSGLLELGIFFDERFEIAAIVPMLTAGTVGLIWLVRKYKQICDTYVIR